ncbi:hypothetical protein ACIQOU_34125 [Streptomyces sp. NPDC091279]|uniref:hypothetical protein n=1 Tax=unclassified Streptomyces TaxID=2593676 RepID=UPI0038061940
MLTSAGLLVVAAPGPTQAATAAGYCAGRKVKDLPFATGTVHLYRRGGYVCAVTVAKKESRDRRTMSVSVRARGNRPVADAGHYTHHAGPVTVYTGHRCVWIKAQVAGGSVSSGWIFC